MSIERRYFFEFDSVWNSNSTPLRKARAFLAIARDLSRLSERLIRLGTSETDFRQIHRRRNLWSHAAQVLHLARVARDHARQALSDRSPKLGFDYSPRAYATPSWTHRPEKLPNPKEVLA